MTEKTFTGEPWSCNDCGIQQKPVTHNGKSFYSSDGWYWVQLRPGAKPVYLDMGCFNSYDQDWPDYVGTHESSAWQSGEWEGKNVWALPADYFERRDAYRNLPRWEPFGDGMKLVTRHQQILGYIQRYTGDIRFKGMYQPLDADRNKLGEPKHYMSARRVVEMHAGLTEPGVVQR
jgi:hypothetical protein